MCQGTPNLLTYVLPGCRRPLGCGGACCGLGLLGPLAGERLARSAPVGPWAVLASSAARRLHLRKLSREKPGQVAGQGEGSGVHAVDVERSVQVIDLVLQDARVPTTGLDLYRAAVVIEGLHGHRLCP